ncbi:MAG: hypothetical protein JO307_03870, partial [Bryobacterales bacterium]|nr:hypothetical protein [Bryobacterales bacterium]
LNTQDFLPSPGIASEILELTAEEREFKTSMMGAFRTQARVLSQFPVSDERFRDAPQYDFARPPHEGALVYERWGFPISGETWRARACLQISGSPS